MNQQVAKPFADIEIGDEIGPMTRVPTLEVVQGYATVARIPDRRFIDPEVAREKGFFKPIVPGPLSATFLAQLLTDHFPGWRLQTFNLSFRAPVAHGDTLNCWGTVTEKNGQEENGTATVHCDVVAENQHGDRIIVGTATLGVRNRRQ
jgi:acyl dehydratase